MVVGVDPRGAALRFGNLMQFGLREYGRMARMLRGPSCRWASRFGLGAPVSMGATTGRDGDPRRPMRTTRRGSRRSCSAVVFVLAHVTVEVGSRDDGRGSVAAFGGQGVVARREVVLPSSARGARWSISARCSSAKGWRSRFGFARTQVSAATAGRARARVPPRAVGGRGDRVGAHRAAVRAVRAGARYAGAHRAQGAEGSTTTGRDGGSRERIDGGCLRTKIPAKAGIFFWGAAGG